ncbi:MAG: DNA polymerase/3'-5' exonuclease PolX [Acidobacteriales bacterium]|nr:DNA polymerase/3'-5' exonuclease PolX [Terriglobales bacterium]
MDNKAIARMLSETADLLEIAGEDSFRIRSYRNASESIDSLPFAIAGIIADDKKLLEISGIGKGMVGHLREMFARGSLEARDRLLKQYGAGVLELRNVQGLGPKTIALIWDAHKVADLAGVEKLAREGKIRTLPRMGEKAEQKILKGIEDLKRISGRYLIDVADLAAQALVKYLAATPGVETVTPAGSLRRGRETIGDLDILITGKGCIEGSKQCEAIIEKVVNYPDAAEVLAKGGNKVSFRLKSGMQVDVRLLPPETFGAAMLYFTGSKTHNVALRQRALKQGLTLSEYGLFRVKDEKRVVSKTEDEIYKKLGLTWMPPEMRENRGELDLSEAGSLPELITEKDIQGDVHMHTVATDGKCTIEEMAQAAKDKGYKYIAITDHSKNLAMANGLDDKRALAHIKKIRAADEKFEGIRIFAGIEVDILADGSLDLSDSVLEEMDVVIASVHSHFNQTPEKMTERLLAAIANPNTSILGHPTGRLLLKREAYSFDAGAVFKAAARRKVAMELNSWPERLDLNDVHLRQAVDLGCKVVINTDAHHTSHLAKIKYGILQARRAWLTKKDVLNTLPAAQFLKALGRG